MGDGTPINVAIYGRVSTEHEEQMSAMENQCAWYESIAQSHNEWNVVERYYDKGITGTAAQKRPAFMQMLGDARAGYHTRGMPLCEKYCGHAFYHARTETPRCRSLFYTRRN